MVVKDAPITIGFLGFFRYTDHEHNQLTAALSQRFSLKVCLPDETGHLITVPEILFVSIFEREGIVPQYRFWPYEPSNPREEPLSLHPRYDGCTKIFTSDENLRTPWYECDYSMTSDYLDDPRHLRLPIYRNLTLHVLASQAEIIRRKNLLLPNPTLLKDLNQDWRALLAKKTKFCNFVYSNSRPQERIMFFKLLSKYKKVDSGGEVLNNIGDALACHVNSHSLSKLAFLQDYKFTIAFEISTQPGYVTEKLTEPMVANSLPIYWGCPRVGEEFNKKSFVDATGRKFQDVVDEVVELDRDDDGYLEMMREPWFRDNAPNQYCDPDYLCDFFGKIVADHRSATTTSSRDDVSTIESAAMVDCRSGYIPRLPCSVKK